MCVCELTLFVYFVWQAMAAGENKQRLSDVLSVLATAIADIPPGTSLRYKLTGNQSEGIGLWGHEYVRNLAGEIGTEFTRRSEAQPAEGTLGSCLLQFKLNFYTVISRNFLCRRCFVVFFFLKCFFVYYFLLFADTADLMKLVNAIVPFHISHNAEAEAVDLLIEVMNIRFVGFTQKYLDLLLAAMHDAG